MPLRCAPSEVAIYLPPRALDVRDSDDSLRRCQAFLEAIEPGTVARVFDDRDAVITFEDRGIWGPRASGKVPAYDELEGESSLRVVVIPHPGAIQRLPKANTSRVEAFAQIFVAEPALVETPDLARLSAGDLETWRPILETLAYQVTREPRIAPPAAYVEALFAEHDLHGWCELAAAVAPAVISSRHIAPQAVGKFEAWLRDAMTGAGLSSPADPYREHVDRAWDALEHLEWDELELRAGSAIEVASESAIEAKRLAAAAKLGKLDFEAGLQDLGSQLLLEAIFGRPWTPARPARFPLDVSPLDNALHAAAWLCTRITSMDDRKWVEALDLLEAVLPSEQREALRAARVNKKATDKPAAKKSIAKKPTAKTPVPKKSVLKKPTAKKPSAKKSTSKKPASKKSDSKKSGSKKPVATKPVSNKFASKKPSGKKATSKKSASKTKR